jgi:phosphohistidine phosphatase
MTEFAILLRHGIAHPRGSMPEETRGLTEEGHRKMKEIARGLARIRPKVNVIYSSPLVRCVETAQYISDRYKLGFEIAEELRPEARPKELRGLLDRTASRIVVCVGHEPTLSAMMRYLTKMRGTIELKKGGCYGVRFTADGPRLEWMLSPRVMRR